MASNDGTSDQQWPKSSFFKLILDQPRLDLHKLEIPRKFMTAYGDDLSNKISLKIPPGKIWEFELVRENKNTAYLQDNWPKFVEYYSLSHGNLLVFKYEGYSRFNVIILDMSASEIEYPKELEACTDEIPVDIESPFESEATEIHQQKRKTTSPTNRPCSSKQDCPGPSKGVNNDKHQDDGLILIYSYCLTPNEIRRVRTYGQPYKNPSFVMSMQPSYVVKSKTSKMGLYLPCEFSRKYLKLEDIPCTLELEVEGSKTIWMVRARKSGHKRVVLQTGWKDFVYDNKLRVGDICIFQMIGKNQFKVDIIRRPENPPISHN